MVSRRWSCEGTVRELSFHDTRGGADNDFGTNEDIYVRCRQGSGTEWKREDLEAADETEYYNLWDEHVMSVSSTGSTIHEGARTQTDPITTR